MNKRKRKKWNDNAAERIRMTKKTQWYESESGGWGKLWWWKTTGGDGQAIDIDTVNNY